jgi:hypothetical protein
MVQGAMLDSPSALYGVQAIRGCCIKCSLSKLKLEHTTHFGYFKNILILSLVNFSMLVAILSSSNLVFCITYVVVKY